MEPSPATHPPLSWMASLRWPIIEEAVRHEPTSGRVLELGCGQGAVGARLAARFDHYLGIEPDAGSAAVAAERVRPHGGEIRARIEDGTVLPASVLCAFEVLEHIEDDAGALRSWTAHAAPGALVVVSVPADPERFSTTDRLVGHFRRYTDESLRALLLRGGLEDVRLRRYGYPLAYALEDVRNSIASRRLAGADETSMEARSHGSGRLLQPQHPWQGIARRALTKPFRIWQDARPAAGPCLVASARVAATL